MKGLLIIDVQNDFFEGGALGVKDSLEIIPVINGLIEKFQKENLEIIGTKDWHPKEHKSFAVNSKGNIGELGELNGLPQVWWPEHCVQNSFGAEFHRDILPIEKIIYKGTDIEIDSYSAFFDNGKRKKTELDKILKEKNIDELYVGGLATDYCVKYTVLDALELGYKVNVIVEACKGVNLNPEDSEKAIEEMKEKGAKILNFSEINF